MNLSHLTLWVDDHLKRRLHEMLGNIAPDEDERFLDVKFEQDRHPSPLGATPGDMARATEYFPRVLRGSLFHALIANPDRTSTPYSELIRDIVLYRDAAYDDRLKCTQPIGIQFRN